MAATDFSTNRAASPGVPALRGIGSMATRGLLAELAAAWAQRSGTGVRFEAVGGVDAAARVAAGERFDVVVLAADAIAKLIAGGRLVEATRTDLVRSPVAVAVRAGAAKPDIASEAAVREAVLAARRIGYSTGPSGTQLLKLFERWDIASRLEGKLLQAKAGVPVASLVAAGHVELGFQQSSELMNVEGIEVLGLLPESIAIVSTFTAAVAASSDKRDAAVALIRFLASTDADETKRRHGMEPAT